MKDFSRLPINQAKLLLKAYNAPDHIITAEGKSEGATAKQLFHKGYFQPKGMIGRRVRWLLIKALSKQEIDQLKELVK